MQNKSRISDRASNATKALETAWSMLIGLHHNIPHAVVALLTAGDRKRERGHLSNSSWKYRDDKRRHEVGISPNLFHDPKSLLCTMLHEATHAILHKENGGCTPDKYNNYHRKSFRDKCKSLGLECEYKDTRRGWTLTSWPDGKIPDIYKPLLKYLKTELPKGTGFGIHPHPPGRKLPKPGHIKLSCRCDKRRTIYVNKSILQAGGIRCDICDSNFLP
ncbi:MAG: hypothetical protein WCJ37_02330 [Syntrophus sp. (in: bacteria)]